MNNSIVSSYVAGLPWVKMWTVLPSAVTPTPAPPVPPTPAPLSISGTIYADGTGFSAPLEISTDGTIFSSAAGSYGFYVASGYSGSTAAHWAGGTFTPLAYHYTGIVNSYINQNFVFYGTVPPVPPTPAYLISGTVTEAGTGFSAGIEFTALGTIFSAASGSYGLNVTAGYSGTAIPHYSGGTFSPQLRTYTSVGTDYPNQDYVFYGTTPPIPPTPFYFISGTTTDARYGGTGFSVPLEITSLGTVFSAASGSYGISVISGYSGTAIPHLSGGSFVPESRTYVSVGSDYANQDYVFYGTVPPVPPVTSYLISGTVTTSGSIGVSCNIVIGIGTITSAASGSYGYYVASGYSGTTQPTYLTSPGSYVYTSVTSDQPNQDFDAPAPFLYYNSLDWTWSLSTNPYYWEIQIDDGGFGMHDLVYGVERTHEVTEYGSWWRIVGRDIALNINTPFSNQVYSTPPPYTISGTVTDARFGGTGFSVALEVSGSGTFFSATSGSYGFNVVSGYSGSVVPHLSGGSFVPTSRNYASVNSDYPAQDYVFYGTSGTTPYVPSTIVLIPSGAASGLGIYSVGFASSPSQYATLDGLAQLYTSTDALNWTATGTTVEPFVSMPNCLAYGDGPYTGGGLYAVGRLDGGIETSPDTFNWTVRVTPTVETFLTMIYADNRFVGGGVNGMVVTSADGTNWSLTTTGGVDNVSSLAYGNGTYVAVGIDGIGNSTIYTSANGTAWALALVPSSPTVTVAYSPDFARFYLGGFAILLESADTVTWTDITGSLSTDIVGLAAGNGTVLAAGYTGTVHCTSDGTNWFQEAVYESYYLSGITTFCSPSAFFVEETTPPT